MPGTQIPPAEPNRRRRDGRARHAAAPARGWGHRFLATSLTVALAVGALLAIVAVAPEVYSPSVAGAANVYTETISGTTGECSGGWFNSSSLNVPPGIISTQVTLVGGGGGGSSANGAAATGGAGGGADETAATIPAASLPAGSVLYAHLGCGGGAGAGATNGTGGVGESDSGAGTTSPTGSGADGGTAQASNAGGGGGGGSALCVVASAAADCTGGTIVGVAGGGGGAGAAQTLGTTLPAVTGASGGAGAASGTSDGGDGGVTTCPGTGESGTCTGGGGGTGSAGAAGTGAVAGNPGVAGDGGSAVAAGSGTGNVNDAAGGGGGGGYFGGGGGAAGESSVDDGSSSGTGGGAASSYWDSSFGGAGTFSNIATTATNCGAVTAECATSTTANGAGGTAGDSGASGSLVVKYTVGAVAAHSSFSGEPDPTVASGTAFAAQPVVTIADYTGAPLADDSVELAIATHPTAGTGTLNCTANPVASSASGVSDFAGCSISGPVGAYTLSATDTADGAVVATSTPVTLTPGPATHLAFLQEPTDVQATAAITPAVTVAVEDANGNVETADSNTTVSLALGTNPSAGALSGSPAVTDAAGIATFSGLSVDKAGSGYTLVASSASYAGATSTAFNVTAGAPTNLVFVQGPSDVAAGSAMSPAVTVAVEDANGNVETGDSNTTVSLAFGTNPSGGILTGGTSATVSSGIATFSGLSVDKAGTGYTLVASSAPPHAGATSSAFTVTAGAPTHLAFLQGPSETAAGAAINPAVTVAVEDANGNVETGDNGTSISLALGSTAGSGTLTGGAAVPVVAGVATFGGLSVNIAEAGYTLIASTTSPDAGTTSLDFTITPGAPTQLAFLQGPTNVTAGSVIIPAVTVAVEDANGNVETGDSNTTVSLALGTNPSAGALSGGESVSVSGGIATFAGLSVNNAGAGYTLVASSVPSDAPATSSPFSIAPGTSNQLAFVQGPSSAVAGTAIGPSVTVAVEDADGNVETSDNGTTVSLAFGINPGGGTLSGGSTVPVSSGIATFSGLSVDKAGAGYTLIASSTPPYSAATSAGFTITPGPPTQLGFVQSPSDISAGSAMAPAVTAAVEDANGNIETGDNSTTIGLGLGTDSGGGSLSGGGAVQVSAGEATFSGLTINSAGIGYTLVAASTPAYPSAPSSSFTVGPGTPTHLAFLQGPTTAAAGAAVAPGVRVVVEDADGNVESGDNATSIALALGNNPGGSSLSGGGAVTVASGVASFNGLSLNKTGSGYTLVASTTSSDAAATSSGFTVTPGQPSQLAFVQGPTNTAAGSAITPSVTVAVEDANGNVETGDTATTVSLAIGTNPGGGTLSGGSAVAVVSGVATFPGVSINLIGAGYTLTASSTPPNTGATSSAFTISPGASDHLAFVQEPGDTTAASAMTPAVTVAVEDASGNVETADNLTQISLAIGTNPSGGNLTGGGLATVAAGVATFSGLSVDKAGNGYTLTASSAPPYATATSSVFTISPGPATQLAFVQKPVTSAAGSAISPVVTVAVEDANGNVETTDGGTQISVALGNNPDGGSLSGGAAVTVTAGVAAFPGLSIDRVGTAYTLVASTTSSDTAATSSAFAITPGLPTQLAFVEGPSNTAAGSSVNPAVTVAVEDADGNVETGDSATTVSLAIGTNPGGGTLSGGGSVAVVNGVATFSGLSVDLIGTGYTLTTLSTPPYAEATSATFDITPGLANHLAFVQPPTNTVAGAAMSPGVSVAIEDATGNVETGDDTTTISLAIGTDAGGGTLTGGGVEAVSGGIASFAGVSIDKIGTGYTLTASSTPTYTPATSPTFNINLGAASHLVFVQGPSTAQSGSAMTPAVTVAVEDASGNVETGDSTTTVSLAFGTNPGGGTLTGGTVAVASGIATFPALSVNKTGTGDTLVASSTPSYAPATSAAFDITPGPATQLAFVQAPTNTVVGATMAPAVAVAVEDANGNVETGDNGTTIDLAIGTDPGGGILTGGGTVSVADGVATFSGLSIGTVGTGYTLTASSSGTEPGVTSATFDITPGAASQLAFVQNPVGTAAGSAIAPAVAVAVEDASGNVETADNSTQISLAIGTNPGGGTLTGGTAVSVTAGVATFSGLSIDKAGTGYTLTASSTPPYTTATSTPVAITPGPATQLAFVQTPTTTTAGTDITPAVTVAVEDANGNVETGDDATTIALAIGTNPGGGTLGGGSATKVASGVATFPSLSIDVTGTGYTLTASSAPTYTGTTSSAFTVNPGQLALSCAPPPSSPVSCQGIDLPTVTLAGFAETAQAPANTIYVSDNRGLAGVGWSVSAYLMPTTMNPNSSCATVATFCNASIGASAATSEGQIPPSNFLVGGITCTAVSGNSDPAPQPGPGGSFGNGPVSLCTAPAGKSAGTFKLGANYSLVIPAGIYAGQYQATVEYLAF